MERRRVPPPRFGLVSRARACREDAFLPLTLDDGDGDDDDDDDDDDDGSSSASSGDGGVVVVDRHHRTHYDLAPFVGSSLALLESPSGSVWRCCHVT